MPYPFGPDGKIIPDPDDYAAVATTHPELADAAKDECGNVKAAAEMYRLAQSHKIIRLYENGLLPLDIMRELDNLAKKRGPISCPFVYANGRKCEGHIYRARAYGPHRTGSYPERHSVKKYRLWCSEKDDHCPPSAFVRQNGRVEEGRISGSS